MADEDQYTAERAHFKEHGWVRIPSLLSKDQADEILTKLWKVKELAEARGDETHLSFLDPNPSNVRIFYLLELDKVFRDLIFQYVSISPCSALKRVFGMLRQSHGQTTVISPHLTINNTLGFLPDSDC
jgi:hypothetical protein